MFLNKSSRLCGLSTTCEAYCDHLSVYIDSLPLQTPTCHLLIHVLICTVVWAALYYTLSKHHDLGLAGFSSILGLHMSRSDLCDVSGVYLLSPSLSSFDKSGILASLVIVASVWLQINYTNALPSALGLRFAKVCC